MAIGVLDFPHAAHAAATERRDQLVLAQHDAGLERRRGHVTEGISDRYRDRRRLAASMSSAAAVSAEASVAEQVSRLIPTTVDDVRRCVPARASAARAP